MIELTSLSFRIKKDNVNFISVCCLSVYNRSQELLKQKTKHIFLFHVTFTFCTTHESVCVCGERTSSEGGGECTAKPLLYGTLKTYQEGLKIKCIREYVFFSYKSLCIVIFSKVSFLRIVIFSKDWFLCIVLFSKIWFPCIVIFSKAWFLCIFSKIWFRLVGWGCGFSSKESGDLRFIYQKIMNKIQGERRRGYNCLFFSPLCLLVSAESPQASTLGDNEERALPRDLVLRW